MDRTTGSAKVIMEDPAEDRCESVSQTVGFVAVPPRLHVNGRIITLRTELTVTQKIHFEGPILVKELAVNLQL
jgi:hypothetical protein